MGALARLVSATLSGHAADRGQGPCPESAGLETMCLLASREQRGIGHLDAARSYIEGTCAI